MMIPTWWKCTNSAYSAKIWRYQFLSRRTYFICQHFSTGTYLLSFNLLKHFIETPFIIVNHKFLHFFFWFSFTDYLFSATTVFLEINWVRFFFTSWFLTLIPISSCFRIQCTNFFPIPYIFYHSYNSADPTVHLLKVKEWIRNSTISIIIYHIYS